MTLKKFPGGLGGESSAAGIVDTFTEAEGCTGPFSVRNPVLTPNSKKQVSFAKTFSKIDSSYVKRGFKLDWIRSGPCLAFSGGLTDPVNVFQEMANSDDVFLVSRRLLPPMQLAYA